jgi:hypothetical protein
MPNLLLPTDTLAQGYPKINAVIEDAEESITTANNALEISNTALNTANNAESKSDATQAQLDSIILESGTSDAETIQARGTFPLLYNRLDNNDSQLASNVTKFKNICVDITYPPIPMVACKVDGNTDDTVALQAIVDYCVSNKLKLRNPVANNYCKLSSPIYINGTLEIEGSGRYSSGYIFMGCDGFIIANGAKGVNFHDFEIALAVRHTTTPNTKKGIIINGTTESRPYNHIYRDIYIDGFETAVESNWIWASLFDNVSCDYGKKGLIVKGLSVNNKIDGNCQFSVDGSPGSRGIMLGDGVNELEGWWINSPLIFGAEIAIQGIGASHIYINNPILDFCKVNGILIGDNGTDFGGNWDISGGYIAMTGSGGEAVIKDTNAIANSVNRGSHIRGTSQLTYPGATCSYGIWMQGAESKNAIITDNTISGFAVNDIYAVNGDNTVIGNKCLSSGITNINAVGNVANNGKAIVYYRRSTNYTTRGMQKETYDEAMPTTGTYNAGDFCWKVNPSEAGTAGSRYILQGWRRLSTGSAHVLNVDWAEMRMLTGQ